ncbi:MAG: hypothetical protein V4721_01385 [Bacteroidota bacterium]
MTFKTRQWLYFYITAFISLGLAVLLWLISTWSEKDPNQKQAFYIVGTIMVVVFFGLPLLTIKNLKIISKVGKNWIFRFPYMNRSFSFDNTSVDNITIIENFGGRMVPTHDIITINTANKKLTVSSLEIKEFQKFKKLISSDFKEKITTKTQNWLGVIVDKK